MTEQITRRVELVWPGNLYDGIRVDANERTRILMVGMKPDLLIAFVIDKEPTLVEEEEIYYARRNEMLDTVYPDRQLD